jgi:hypothetical protein
MATPPGHPADGDRLHYGEGGDVDHTDVVGGTVRGVELRAVVGDRDPHQAFDAGVPKKFVIDPHGTLARR